MESFPLLMFPSPGKASPVPTEGSAIRSENRRTTGGRYEEGTCELSNLRGVLRIFGSRCADLGLQGSRHLGNNSGFRIAETAISL